MFKKISFGISTLVILSVILAACAPATATPAPQATPLAVENVIAEGRLEPRNNALLSFGVRGTVSEILVKPGQKVKAGDVLARLDNYPQAEAAVVSAQQAYDGLIRTAGLDKAQAWTDYLNAQKVRAEAERDWEAVDVDARNNEVEDRRADLEDAETDLQDAQDEFDKYKDLDKDNSRRNTAETDLENAQEDYNEAMRDLEEAQRKIDEPRAALDLAFAAEAEAKFNFENSLEGANKDKVAFAQAQLDAAKSTLAGFEINAPFNGTVAEINISLGQSVGPETTAFAFADFSEWVIKTTDLTELEVVKIKEGQQVTFSADAIKGVEMNGVVEFVSQTYKSQSGDILYTVKIKASNVDPLVRWGMTVEINFLP